MALKGVSYSDISNLIIGGTISTSPGSLQGSPGTSFLEFTRESRSLHVRKWPDGSERRHNMGSQGRKSRRKPRVCKNQEEAETLRMTHIAVERNRRKQMNEHLAVLRSLMPASYARRGDQASTVGGAIEFVKKLEHLLQTLEAHKLQRQLGPVDGQNAEPAVSAKQLLPPSLSPISMRPQYANWSQIPNKFTLKSKAAIADVEVTLIETHANLRVLSRSRTPRQLPKLVAGFQGLHLTILHLNVTTLDALVLYSISAKVEEGCQLRSGDDIAATVHCMLRIIEEEAAASSSSKCDIP